MRRWVLPIAAAVLATSLAAPHAEGAVARHGALARSTPRAADAGDRRVLLVGRGWGHGRGMGQYGARGMALNGARWPAIARHYYRGVRVAKVSRTERIRVLLSTQRVAYVTSGHPFVIRWRNHTTRARAHRFYRFHRSGTATVAAVAADLAGPYRRVVRAGGVVRLRGRFLATVARDASQRGYRGSLLLQPRRGKIGVVNDLLLQDYLRGVVPREMPSLWPLEALKAQAVAARTYSHRVRMRARSIGSPHDICDDARCQVYGGAARRTHARASWRSLESSRTDHAIRATGRQILTYRGRPILAEYSSSTGGHTTTGDAGYLRPVSDPADRISPYHVWAEELTARQIQARWPEIGSFRRLRLGARDGNGAWGGRVGRVTVVGSRQSVTVKGARFQAAFGLRSRWFRIANAPSRTVFRRNLGFGSHSLDVTALQQRLRAEGFYPSDAPITSYFGEITRASLRRFQAAHRLAATGYLGRATRAVLNRRAPSRYRFTVDLGVGSRGHAVTMLQRRLRAEHVYPASVPITGYFGDITRASVRRYQRAHGIRSTGYLGPVTRARLNRA